MDVVFHFLYADAAHMRFNLYAILKKKLCAKWYIFSHYYSSEFKLKINNNLKNKITFFIKSKLNFKPKINLIIHKIIYIVRILFEINT